MTERCPSPTRRLRAAAGLAAFLLPLLSLSPAAHAQSSTARIWFYRDYSPYVNTNYATVSINGVVAGSVDPYGGAIYRDVPPGHYHLTASSYVPDPSQSTNLDLASGQEAYVKIESLPSWQTPSLSST